MKIRDCALTAGLALAIAGPAAAAIKTITFQVAGDWTILDVGLPFGFTQSPAFSGWFAYDDTDFFTVDKNGETAFMNIVALHVSPGNQVWAFGDRDPVSYVQAPTPTGPVDFWALGFVNIYSPNSNHSNQFDPNFAILYDGVNSAMCRGCVTWEVIDGLPGGTSVPEPATWAMMIAGFGLAGAMLRRRAALV